jgi:hypothetical protein
MQVLLSFVLILTTKLNRNCCIEISIVLIVIVCKLCTSISHMMVGLVSVLNYTSIENERLRYRKESIWLEF